MSDPETPPTPRRDQNNWAGRVDRLSVGQLPAEAINLNVQGRRTTSPLQGFGQLWQKTYAIRLQGVEVTPAAVIQEWKANFSRFWPRGNSFYGSLQGIRPGEVAVLNLSLPGGGRVSTGVRVIYADEESFSFMTPEGHMFAGMITFSATDDGGTTVIQIQALIRASDPIYEAGFRLGLGHKAEDQFWADTLRNLARHFGATASEPTLRAVCIDHQVQWREAGNVWQNAAVRTALYLPVLLVRRLFRRG